MKEEHKNLKANEPVKPVELSELDEFLAKAKAQNPVKFALKEKAGEFDKLRKSLGGK